MITKEKEKTRLRQFFFDTITGTTNNNLYQL